MAAGKRVHRTRLELADMMQAEVTAVRKPAPDNRPTPEEVAAMARQATGVDVDHAADILTACEASWSKEELARFWAAMR